MTRSTIHHFGFAVRDLDESIAFYEAAFGLEVVDRALYSGEALAQVVDVPGAVLEYAFLAGANTVLELIEYKQPRGRDFALNNNDVGNAHICFVVEDIEAMHAKLLAMGARFSAPPQQAPEDPPFCGLKYAYCRDLNGVTIELYQPGTGELSLPKLLAAGKRLAAGAV
jgi:catechol 2,3-dioxygenase-like lactoylglutathione lyase family enzyme